MVGEARPVGLMLGASPPKKRRAAAEDPPKDVGAASWRSLLGAEWILAFFLSIVRFKAPKFFSMLFEKITLNFSLGLK